MNSASISKHPYLSSGKKKVQLVILVTDFLTKTPPNRTQVSDSGQPGLELSTKFLPLIFVVKKNHFDDMMA